MFELVVALSPTDPKFIAWICKDVMALTFFILFISIRCKGKNETGRKNTKTFQRLRLCVIIMTFCDFFWPFNYYFNLNIIFKVITFSLASMFDLLSAFTVSVLSLRVFSAYYHTKQVNKIIPWYYLVIIWIYMIEIIISVIWEILAFSMDHSKMIEYYYMINSIIWFSITCIFSFTLIIFLFRIIRLFKKTTVNHLAIGPLENQSLRSNNFQQQLNCTAEKAKYLYLKMIWLCTGIVVYYANLLGAWLYFFITWNFYITETLFWIIQHEMLGHLIFYVTLWSYLRVINDDDFAYKRMKKRTEDVAKECDQFGVFCNSKTMLSHLSAMSNTTNTLSPQIIGKKDKMISADTSETASDFSTTYNNTDYHSVTIET